MTTAAVIGLGTMGPGIAATLARGGMTVRAYDCDAAAIEASRGLIEAADAVLDALEMPDLSGGASVSVMDDLEACVDRAELVIETIPEDLALKRDLFARLDGLISSDCVLASDTSGIPISQLQEGNSNPGRVIGMHWSNPPHIIPIVEVIAGAQTAAGVVNWMVERIKAIHLLPVVVKKDVPGFVENRVLYALLRECIDLVENEVIDPESLDTCVSWGIGYKLSVVGPMALLDMAGLDIYQSVGSYLNKDLCRRDDVSSFVTERTGKKRLGLKTGGGIFGYSLGEIQALRRARAEKLVAVRKALKGT
jgi:3-hydroxybutyryl-CoA dehydrogenase/5-formyl-3-hydroxy-2-methylpyridine 4-carboxylate dehydrogenase